jgi:hypothetical protein|tara:strand:- start:9291 stop:9677 length:387 start_codon:yes stop_codon:yes gene_type:complete
LKKCRTCKKEKPITQFYGGGKFNLKGEEYLDTQCKSCKTKYKHTRRKERKDWLNEIKIKLKCSKCGYSKDTHPNFSPKALDFHHPQNNKSFMVGDGVHRGFAKDKILNEINKCVVLCNRCHTEIHYEK